MPKMRSYSKYTTEVIQLLGRQIRLGRKQRRWSELALAERAGIARATLQKIERGDPTSTIGLAVELAVIVGVRLFESDMDDLAKQRAETEALLCLLPKNTHTPKRSIDD